MSGDEGASNPIGNILIIAITFVIAAVILSQLLQLPAILDPTPTVVFEITKIRHVNDMGVLTYDSRVMLVNIGNDNFKNRNLMAKIYRNGIPLTFIIASMNGNDYIAHYHTQGVDIMGGPGCSGATWSPGEMLYIDFKDRTFHPEDTVRIEIYDKTTNQIISSDTYPHAPKTASYNIYWFNREVLNHQGA
jgi:flagellin-like protein